MAKSVSPTESLRSFQPFFIEHNPPKLLTEGDEISLPVVLRNYGANPLKLEAEMKAAPWFSFISQPRQQVSVLPNGNANVVFAFRADSATRSGTQRVVARNSVAGDAVEQQVTVHPNGQEITTTTAKILVGADDHLDIDIPKTAISASADVELMLYPSLIAHVLEAMNGIGQRPGGCMEQVTSIAYVNLLGLKLLKKQGMIDGSAQADLVLKAELRR